jgi:uncharacterized membrane protein YgcG
VARRLSRLLMLLALLAPGVASAGAGTAFASTGLPATAHAAAKVTKPGVLQTAWFWQKAAEQANPPVTPPVAAPEPSGVPKGDLAVAHTSNDASSSKMSVVAFHLPALKSGATIENFSVSLTLDSSASAGNVSPAKAAVVACLPTRLWSAGEGNDYTNEPSVDCSNKVAPSVKGNTWTFTISALAQQWVGQDNLGVAFVNDPANTTTPFQTVFSGGKSIKASMTFLPALPTPPPASSGNTGSNAAATGSSAGNTGTGNGGGTSSSGAGTAPLAVTGGALQPPLVAGSAPITAPSVTAAGHPRTASSAPSRGFWIAGAALALLIVCAAAVLADHQVPVPTATTTKLGQVLRDRERDRARSAAAGQSAEVAPTFAPRRA